MSEENEIRQEISTEGTIPTSESVKTISSQEANPERNKSNNRILIINLVLFAGLIILYLLFFLNKPGTPDPSMVQAVSKASKGDITVAYVNNDSILEHYELVKKLKKELQAKGDRYSSEVASKQAGFEKDAAYFQEQVQKKTISDQSAQEIYSSLMESQQKIYDLRDRYAQELQLSETEMNVVLLDSVMNFLKRYNTRYRFDYILGFNKVGSILYANDTLDITNDVIKEMNKEYSTIHGNK